MALADRSLFARRLGRLYEFWKESMKTADAISIVVTQDEDVIYSKAASMMIWLFGYELRDTILVFSQKDIFALTSKKKIEFLRPLRDALSKKDDMPNFTLLTKVKGDSGEEHMKTMVEGIKDLKTVGYFPKDMYKGALMKLWSMKLKATNLEQVDITSNMALCLAVKDDTEIALIKKAAQMSSDVFSKHVRNELMNIVDEEKRIKHNKLATNIETVIQDGKKYLQPGMDKEQVELCYTPIVQSAKFALKFSVVSDENRMDYSNNSSILISFGARYKSYCSNISRTVLVEPSKTQQENYEFAVEVLEKAYSTMKEGTKLCDVYNACVAHIKEKKEGWLPKFVKNIGFGTGIEFREGSLLISAKNEAKLKKNMLFNIHLGFVGLQEGDKEYAVMVGDTVLVGDNGAVVLTPAKKKVTSIGIFMKGDGEEEEEEEENIMTNMTRQSKRSAVIDNKLRQEPAAEDKRKSHQRELTDQLNKEARERIAAKNNGATVKKKVQTSVAYKNSQSFPISDSDIKELKIMVDKKHESVIIPIFGVPTPFHISTIKNVSKSEEGDFVYLRINLNVPGTVVRENDFVNPDATFMKEITFRSSIRKSFSGQVPATNLNNAFRIIKEVQKKFKQVENEKKEMEDVIDQETLKITQTKGNPRLKDLYCRPNLSTRRVIGSLEAHSNGFRFHDTHGANVDVIYNTIKNAFFQPCDKEMLILLHFNLKHPILIGKKKTYHIQFYTEVGEIMTDLGKNSHMYDRDDLEAEQGEREMRQKLKGAFKNFIEKVENLTKGRVEFDVPFRELGFPGVPLRSSCLLQPTTHCLINVVEWPPFVIVLEEVELIHFERVQFQLKNFDMVFIFKDYSKKIEMINSVPMASLDGVKEWLNSCDIKYTEGASSLNWTKIMKTINDDHEEFFEAGGWKFLDPESDAEGEEDSDEEGDGEWAPEADKGSDEEGGGGAGGSGSGAGSEEETDSDEDYDSDSENSDDEMESGSGSGSEESGKDWSDLEEEARKDDANKNRDQDVDESPSKKKRKHGSMSKKSSHKSPQKKHKRRK